MWQLFSDDANFTVDRFASPSPCIAVAVCAMRLWKQCHSKARFNAGETSSFGNDRGVILVAC